MNDHLGSCANCVERSGEVMAPRPCIATVTQLFGAWKINGLLTIASVEDAHPGRGRANAEASEESVGSGSLKTQMKREAGPVWRGNDLPGGPKRIH